MQWLVGLNRQKTLLLEVFKKSTQNWSQ